MYIPGLIAVILLAVIVYQSDASFGLFGGGFGFGSSSFTQCGFGFGGHDDGGYGHSDEHGGGGYGGDKHGSLLGLLALSTFNLTLLCNCRGGTCVAAGTCSTGFNVFFCDNSNVCCVNTTQLLNALLYSKLLSKHKGGGYGKKKKKKKSHYHEESESHESGYSKSGGSMEPADKLIDKT